MELLLLMLLPAALLGAMGGGGSDAEAPDPQEPEQGGAIRVGSQDDESLQGGAGDDLIFAGGGPDAVNGSGGNDILFGEAQDDRMEGGAGDDILFGGFHDDALRGGADDDLLMGGAGADTLSGEDGNDVIIGGSDFDRLYGGAGDDVVSGVELRPEDRGDPQLGQVVDQMMTLVELRHGAEAAEQFSARIERSVLSSNVPEQTPENSGLVLGSDVVEGGAGNDTLFGDEGDLLRGGEGSDRFIVVHVPESEPVTIADFAEDDLISLDMGDAAGPLGFTRVDEGVLITVGDAAVAVVLGIYDPAQLVPRVTLAPDAAGGGPVS